MYYAKKTSFQTFCTDCVSCSGSTSKSYARAHAGQCKACVTGEAKRGLVCPTCGEHTLTAYQKARGYHCDGCTRQADPMGYAMEVRGF